MTFEQAISKLIVNGFFWLVCAIAAIAANVMGSGELTLWFGGGMLFFALRIPKGLSFGRPPTEDD